MDHVELVEHPDDIADDHDDGSNTCGGGWDWSEPGSVGFQRKEVIFTRPFFWRLSSSLSILQFPYFAAHPCYGYG